jgi:hypothetical protein
MVYGIRVTRRQLDCTPSTEVRLPARRYGIIDGLMQQARAVPLGSNQMLLPAQAAREDCVIELCESAVVRVICTTMTVLLASSVMYADPGSVDAGFEAGALRVRLDSTGQQNSIEDVREERNRPRQACPTGSLFLCQAGAVP